MTEALISITNLSKTYRGRTVLEVPRLVFEPGISYALIGANGSGKSTLLRLLAGVIAPTAGSIEYSGNLQRQLAYLPQKPYAFSFSVRRNLTMAMPGLDAGQQQQLAERLLAELGIDHLAEAKGNRLSGGESQRLALARLLVRHHDLLLLDEPTSATDIAGNDLVEQALCAYRARENCPLIFATHALPQAKRLAGRVLFFHQGRIVEQGDTGYVLSNPQSEECQAFLRFWQN